MTWKLMHFISRAETNTKETRGSERDKKKRAIFRVFPAIILIFLAVKTILELQRTFEKKIWPNWSRRF
jgi:hypothetical protein